MKWIQTFKDVNSVKTVDIKQILVGGEKKRPFDFKKFVLIVRLASGMSSYLMCWSFQVHLISYAVMWHSDHIWFVHFAVPSAL